MNNIITVTNDKGGVGKTTTTVNLAASYASMGKNVLVIDLDPQRNATDLLGITQEQTKAHSLAQAIFDGLPADNLVVPTNMENLFLIPANPELRNVIKQLGPTFRQDKLLRKLLSSESLEQFDVTLIDTHGSRDCLLMSALAESHYYMIPLFPESDSARGLYDILVYADEIRREINPTLTLLGLVITAYDKKMSTHRKFEQAIRDYAKQSNLRVFETSIPSSAWVKAAANEHQPLANYRKDAAVTLSYQALAGELLPLLKGKRTGRVAVPNISSLTDSIEEVEEIFK